MLQITITDPTNREREIVRELLDNWPSDDGDSGAFLGVAEEKDFVKAILPTPDHELVKENENTISISSSGLDKDGLPWDERIHSGNHQLTQDGYWRKRRGVTEDQVAAVESELRGTPPPPPPPVVEPANPMGAFIAFVGRVMAAIGDKTLTQAQVDEACRKHDVSSLAALGQKTELVATVEEELFP